MVVRHLNVFGKAKSVNKAPPALLTDMDPTITMHSAVPFKTCWICNILITKWAQERLVTCVETNMAFKVCFAVEDLTTFPTLILEQASANDIGLRTPLAGKTSGQSCNFVSSPIHDCAPFLPLGKVFLAARSQYSLRRTRGVTGGLLNSSLQF